MVNLLAGLLVGSMAVGVIFLSVLIYVVFSLGYYAMFKKMGIEGWKAFIPFYNGYVMAEKTSKPVFFWVVLGLGLAMSIIPVTLNWVLVLPMSILCCIMDYYMVKSFGKDGIWTLGMVFLPFIFTLILGFGSSRYVGNYYLLNK